MISTTQAFELILTRTLMSSSTTIPLSQAMGKTLAEVLFADRDQPPFHRAMMDGIALKHSQLQETNKFRICAIASAGRPGLSLPEGNSCVEIMTGAVVPQNADLVIRYEDLKIQDDVAEVVVPAAELTINIHPQGHDYRKGDQLLASGKRINSALTAILASAGITEVKVRSAPAVSILSTGDELVELHQVPRPHEIRWSNGITLQQELSAHGFSTLPPLLVSDDEVEIRAAVEKLLASSELLLITGGVSAGKFDHIPKVLKDCGVMEVFHKVLQRPGKPLWFGETKEGKLVLGLPGNPVSCLVNLRRFVVPLLQKSLGLEQAPLSVRLSQKVRRHPELTVYAPVRLETLRGELLAHPIPGSNSGDFFHLRDSHGFVELPPGPYEALAGENTLAYLWGGPWPI